MRGAEQDFDGLGQGVEEDEDLSLGVGVDVASDGRTLSLFERWLDGQMDGTYDAVIGKSALQQMRYAVGKLKKVTTEAASAEQRGYDRAKRELQAGQLGDPATIREELRAEVRQELLAETSRARNLARLGVPPELESLFPEPLDGDFKAWQRRADELRAAGVQWNQDPEAQSLAAARVRAWQDQAAAAEQNGHVDVSPSPMPEQVRDDLIRKGVEAMAQTQAGGAPPHAPDLESDIRKAARNPGAYSPEELEGLANRFNRELDGLSHYMGGGGPL